MMSTCAATVCRFTPQHSARLTAVSAQGTRFKERKIKIRIKPGASELIGILVCTGRAKGTQAISRPLFILRFKRKVTRLRSIASALSILLGACTSASHTETEEMMPRRLAGAQDPAMPHPGTITARFMWNHSTDYWKAADFPDSFAFRCFDNEGNPTARSKAAWCIPVVEVVTVSTDKEGKPVAPKGAASVSNSVYGPGHVSLEHTSAQSRYHRAALPCTHSEGPLAHTMPKRTHSVKSKPAFLTDLAKSGS